MIYVFSSLHPLSDSRIFYRQVRSLAGRYPVTFFARAVDGPDLSDKRLNCVPLRQGRGAGVRLANVLTLLRIAFRKEARVIHFHDPELLLVGILVKLFTRKKVVYDVHENYRKTIKTKTSVPAFLRKPIAWIFLIIEELGCRLFDLVLVVTNELEDLLPGNVHTVKNFPLVGAVDSSDKPGHVLKTVYVGLISPGRGVMNVIEAVKMLDFPVSFDLIGHFNNDDFKKEVLAHSGTNENINYISHMPYDDLFEHLSRYNIGLMCLHASPNHLTSMPNKMFEYMAVGLAVVASDFPAWRQIISAEKCGLLVNPEEPEEIAAAIRHLNANRELLKEMGQNARRAYLSKYNWESQAEKMLALYEEMLGE